jgi:hypothetical protein
MTEPKHILFRPPRAAAYVGLSVPTLAKQVYVEMDRSSSAFRRARSATCRPILTTGWQASAAAPRPSTAG